MLSLDIQLQGNWRHRKCWKCSCTLQKQWCEYYTILIHCSHQAHNVVTSGQRYDTHIFTVHPLVYFTSNISNHKTSLKQQLRWPTILFLQWLEIGDYAMYDCPGLHPPASVDMDKISGEMEFQFLQQNMNIISTMSSLRWIFEDDI